MHNFSDQIQPDRLKMLFSSLSNNSISAGVDGINGVQFEQRLDNEIDIITRKIHNGSYRFSRFRERLILKGRYKHPRIISIPTWRDKLVLKAMQHYLNTLYSETLVTPSIHEMILRTRSCLLSNKYDAFIKLDIENYLQGKQ